ncbi:MAG: hypothetical protein NTW20_13360 [Rhodobacterales bacterium]|nr:hypothetical protein [Rhodobacterales bacterium]
MRFSLTVVLTLVALALGLAYLTLAYGGKSFRLPTAAVAEIETRLNNGLVGARLPPGTAVSLGSVELAVDEDFLPRFRLGDIRLLDAQGRSLLSLPEALVSFDPKSFLSGSARPTSVRLVGARLSVRRDADGRLDLEFGTSGPGPRSLGEVLDATVALFAAPALQSLRTIEADGLTLTLTDDRVGRSWDLGDGRLSIENRPDQIAAELGVTLIGADTPAQATLILVTEKADGAARLSATLDNMASADLAAAAPPLAFLGAVSAPISGRVTATISDGGAVEGFEAELSLAAGSIAPGTGARAIAFDRAALSLDYDPVTARLSLTELSVESPSLRLRANGHGDLVAANGAPLEPGEMPAQLLAQIAFSEVVVDPEGLFEEPVAFSQGALDLRLSLAPLRLEIGQLALVDATGDRLLLSGDVVAADGGWSGGLDVSLDRIDAPGLLKLWPVSVVPKTRKWFADNVGQADLADVRAALRLTPGMTPRLSLGYEFAEAEVRFVRTLPPVLGARGHATLENKTYTVKLERGHIIPPEGGRIEADGSVFQVIDVTQHPATAKISLVTSSSLTATLSLLDQEPFSFFSKAGQPVNLGDGRAELTATLLMPLQPKIMLEDVTYVVAGRIVDFTSPALVPGHILTAPEVAVAVDPDGLTLSGKGMLDLLPVDLTYLQGFGPEQKGRARVNGTVMLSDAALRDLGVNLPEGMVAGEGPAAIDIALVNGRSPQLTLTSNLKGLALRLDALGWKKPAATKGALDLEARLSRSTVIERLVLSAPGLDAEGEITTREGGGLDEARFTSVRAGDWLNAPVTLTGTGKNGRPLVAVTGGQLDLRAMPDTGTGDGDGGPIDLALDRLIVSPGIALTDFRGDFDTSNGLNGQFTALVNGGGAIAGGVAPFKAGGSAIRITSKDAGAVMASAGIFDKGRGGSLDLTLLPRGPDGHYDGRATFTRLRVQDAPALASLLSAISVVGLLEQMAGEGLAFNNGEVSFILTPDAVEITQGSAVGASLGISFAGLYQTAGGKLDLQGVISPIYLVNAIGQIFSRRGEGLFGFNYQLTGSADAPQVSFNPLSVFTPGMFREIFRSGPPNLRDATKDTGG